MYHLTNCLAKLGIEEHLVSGVEEDARFEKGVTIHNTLTLRFRFKSGFYAWAASFWLGGVAVFVAGLCTMLRNRNRFDIIHGHDLFSTFLFVIAKRFLRFKTLLIFTIHGSTSRLSYYSGIQGVIVGIGRSIELFVWEHADFLVVLGQKAKQELTRDWGIEPGKIGVVEQGVDSKFFVPDVMRLDNLKKIYAIPDNYCLFVGRLSPLKGPQYLLRALVDIDVNCLIVGDGPFRRELKTMTQELGISRKVTFTGLMPLSDVKALYGGALFFVLPTLKEGSPLVILEAMSSSLPVISTNISGIPDVVKDGYNGFLIPPADIVSLRKRIEDLTKDPELRKSMRAHARQTALDNDWKNVARKYEHFYRSIV